MRRVAGKFCRALAIAVGLSIYVADAVPAQPAPPAGIEVIDVPLAAWIASRDHALPGTLQNFSVESARQAAFRDLTRALAAADWARASQLAMPLRYQLVAILEAGKWFVVASDDSRTGRDPTLIVNVAPRRDLILQAPHVPFERGTAEQAAVLLRDLEGRAAIVSGAHRCASKAFTACDGRTPVRGSLESYRDSDPGHDTGTLFHTAHLEFLARWKLAIVVSLHGMKDEGEDATTSVIISNGARADDSEKKTAATRLRLALEPAVQRPGLVVSCNLRADETYNYRKLCGQTNVQGRNVNGGSDACHGSVERGTGRFVHVEQDWKILRPYAYSWARIDQHAFSKAFIEAFAAVVPVLDGR